MEKFSEVVNEKVYEFVVENFGINGWDMFLEMDDKEMIEFLKGAGYDF